MATAAPPARRAGLFGLHGVTVRFGGVTALHEVDLDVRPGEVHGVIGPNGAGKTTLFNVACGFVRPDEGQVELGGTRSGRVRPRDLTRHGVARTLQGLGLFERMTVRENVMVGADHTARTPFVGSLLALPGQARAERALAERADEVLAELGIAEHADTISGSLPYPVRKRTALARALVADPTLLLLDEPASGLSEAEMDDLGDLVLSLRERVSVLLVEHHMDLVMRVCDTITVLDFGRVIACGPPEQVRDDPAVAAAYLGTVVETGAETSLEIPAETRAETHDEGGA